MKHIRQQKRCETEVTPENYDKRRALNPGCSNKRNALQLASGYQPPLLGTQKQFCTEAILKGVPVQHCNLEKPVKSTPGAFLHGEKPAKDPLPAKSLENWGKWCDEWYKTQLLVRPTDPYPPSIMTAAEGHRRKREDVEVISRTLPQRSLYGYNTFQSLKVCHVEGLTKPIYRTQPLERVRIPKDIRDELSLPYREVDECYKPQVDDVRETSWQWDKNWKKSIPVGVAKLFLRRDMEKEVGKPIDEDSLFLYGVKAALEGDDSDDEGIPELLVNGPKEDVKPEPAETTDQQKTSKEAEIYAELHGPILLVNGPTMTLVMRQRQPNHPPVDEYIFDKMEEFACTTECKETRHLRLTNKGTTAIRYQWLRTEPNQYLRKLLANPGKQLQLETETKTGTKIPVDLLKSSEPSSSRQIGQGNKTVAVKMTKSRRVDPFLTRTIKILRNSISANPAYENFLLLLSFRIPRLRRALIRRTGRQLTRSALPAHIRELYLKLVDDRRINRSAAEKSARQKKFKRSLSRRRRQKQMAKTRSKSRSRSRALKRKKLRAKCKMIEKEIEIPEPFTCCCECEFEGEDPDWKVCECYPQIEENTGEEKGEWEDEDSAEALHRHGSGSSEGFEEELRDLEESPPSLDEEAPTEGVRDTAQVHQSNYADGDGLTRVEHETQFIKPPSEAGIQNWKEEQRNSLTDPTSELKRTASYSDTDEEPFPTNCPTFHELQGYEVRHDFDAERHLTRIEIEEERDVTARDNDQDRGDTGASQLGENDFNEGHPLRYTRETHRLNTQTVDLDLQAILRDQEGLEPEKQEEPQIPDFDLDLYRDLLELEQMDAKHIHKHVASGGSISLTPSFIQHLIKLSDAGLPLCHGEEAGECDDGQIQDQIQNLLLRHNENKAWLSMASLVEPNRFSHGHPEHHRFKSLHNLATLRMKAHLEKLLKKRVKAVLKKVSKPNRVRFIKEPSYDFHFRELPGVLLPGQTDKLEIMFRPRKPGFYNEKVYLLTHPRLGDVMYGIQLGGVCMGPDFQAPKHQEKTGSSKVEKVEKVMTRSMLLRQSARAMDSILDNVINLQNTKKSTLPYGRVSAEDVFAAHNANLYYHHGISEKSLEIVRNLDEYFIPNGVLPPHPKFCHLDIQSLYHKICEPVDMANPNNFFWKNLCNSEMDPLLTEFARITKIQKRSEVVGIPSQDERKHLYASRVLAGLIDEGVRKMKQVDRGLNHPNRALLARRALTDRLEKRRAREVELRKLAEKRVSFSASALRLSLQAKKIMKDASTQKPDPLQVAPSEAVVPNNTTNPESSPSPPHEDETAETTSAQAHHAKKKKGGKEKEPKPGGKGPGGKKGKKGKEKDHHAQGHVDSSLHSESVKDQSPEEMVKSMSPEQQAQLKSASPVGSGPYDELGVPRSPADLTLEFHLKNIREKSGNQAKLMILENVLNRGIDRILYTIDSMNSKPPGREPGLIGFKPTPWYEIEASKLHGMNNTADSMDDPDIK